MTRRSFTYRTLPLNDGGVAELSFHAGIDKLILTVKDKQRNMLLSMTVTPPVFKQAKVKK